jgi:hypothetical protein
MEDITTYVQYAIPPAIGASYKRKTVVIKMPDIGR